MRLKFLVSLFAFLTLCGGTTYAQDDTKKEVFAGYSYVRYNPGGVDGGFNLNGGSAAFAYQFNNWLSGVADFGGYHNGNISHGRGDGALWNFLVGPRFSLRSKGRVVPFAETLFGAVRGNPSVGGQSGTSNAFGMTLGGGVDYRINHRFSVRAVQVDYLLTRFTDFSP